MYLLYLYQELMFENIVAHTFAKCNKKSNICSGISGNEKDFAMYHVFVYNEKVMKIAVGSFPQRLKHRNGDFNGSRYF